MAGTFMVRDDARPGSSIQRNAKRKRRYTVHVYPSFLFCEHITKTFSRALVPVRNLQERLVRGSPSRRQWSMTALNDVSLRVAAGEWVGIHGPNGCGKTTLLRILAGLLVQDSGTVERRGRLSCFFDLSIGFHEERTADENVRMHALLQGMGPEQMGAVLERARAFADIGNHWELPMKCYSTGMRLRLGFATTTAAPGDILLLDEVLAVGDASFQKRCWERLHELKASGRSAIMVSHYLPDMSKICDRILFLEQGRLVREERVPPRGASRPSRAVLSAQPCFQAPQARSPADAARLSQSR